MSKGIRLTTAMGALRTVNSLNYLDMIESLGLGEPEWELLSQKSPWMAKHRPIIETLGKNLIYAGLDLMGVNRFPVSAEYVAAVAVTFISECNYMHFSQWMGSFATADELGNFDGSRQGHIEGMEKITPSQLHALILELRGNPKSNILCRRFHDKTQEQLPDPMERMNDETKKQSSQKRKTS